MGNDVIVKRPGVDWLTLTSFDPKEEEVLLKTFWCVGSGNAKTTKKGQYKGIEKAGSFIGVGNQTDNDTGEIRKHVMLNSWGSCAQDILLEIGDRPIKVCKRIDLQITIPMPFDYRARHLKDLLEDAGWNGRKRTPRLLEGGEGLDTVSVGSRTSDRYIRIYVKLIDGLHWLRFEVEYKGKRAGRVYKEVVKGNSTTMGGILRAELDALPEVADTGMAHLRECLFQTAFMVERGERIRPANSTINWLRKAVDPAIRRAVYDHDEGQEVRELVERWYNYVQDLDKSSTWP
jgi:hypothetical protein